MEWANWLWVGPPNWGSYRVEWGSQIKTAPEPPVTPLRQQREAAEGLARR